jgi:crossover junction endodeoxyribonuclease RuvC
MANSSKDILTILGIDPGTADTGYGVLHFDKGKKSTHVVSYGSVKTTAGVAMPKRLHKLYNDLNAIFEKHTPGLVVIEKLFFNTNAKTAISVGQARGVVMLLCSQYQCSVIEYTALQAKLALTGYGRASKSQIQARVGEILKIKEKIRPDDAADGLAMALCYLYKNELPGLHK